MDSCKKHKYRARKAGGSQCRDCEIEKLRETIKILYKYGSFCERGSVEFNACGQCQEMVKEIEKLNPTPPSGGGESEE